MVRFLFPKSQIFIDWHLFKATLSVLGLIFTKTWKSADTVNRAIFTLFQPAILSSPKQSCVKWGVFLTFEFAQSLIRPLTIKAKEAKLKRGRTVYSRYPLTIELRSLNSRGISWKDLNLKQLTLKKNSIK